MDLKAFFSADDAEAMLEEAIRGEKAALEEYKRILDDTSLPTSTAGILRTQQQKIASGLSVIKSLKDLR